MILEYNLQFFAKDGPDGEKTEEPTAKKKSDTRKEGNVAKSKEIANCTLLLAFFVLLKIYVGSMGISFMETFQANYNKIPELVHVKGGVDEAGIVGLLQQIMTNLLWIVLPIYAIAFVVAFVTDLVQVKWAPTSKPLKPKFSKLNPAKGFKRLFSVKSLIELFKSLIKIAMIGYIVISTLQDSAGIVMNFFDMSVMGAVSVIGNTVIDLGIKIAGFYIIIAGADYAYTKWKFHEDLKMTKQEVKDEYKNAEGDPAVKGKIRQKMQEASRRRMMQAIPQADVVITNPTHYAVAISYDPNKYDAPYVLAKGQDHLAQKIKEIARENQIEIVENKPLARMLYHNVEIGDLVPPELFQSVAEVLAFVYNVKGTKPPVKEQTTA